MSDLTAEELEQGRRNLLSQLRQSLRKADLSEYPVDAATMRDLVEVLEGLAPEEPPVSASGLPPCPHCGHDVRNVEVETPPDSGFSAAGLTRVPPRDRYYRLRPCGDDVQGYDCDASGKVFRWHP